MTRTNRWREELWGDSHELRLRARESARRAQRQLAFLVPLLAVVLGLYRWRREIFGLDEEIRLATAAMLVIIGWQIARGLGRALRPRLIERLDPRAAGVVGWLVGLFTLAATILVSLRVAGVQLSTLALGASFTAVVLGLAAQQTIGNLLAGIVLMSARPFGVGDRVQFRGFGFDVEGTVTSQGLLYVTMMDGDDTILLPNATALTQAVRPLREPASVDMLARLPVGTDPVEVQQRVQEHVEVPTRRPPEVSLEEFDGERVVFRVRATPRDRTQGGPLARQVLAAVTDMAGRADAAVAA